MTAAFRHRHARTALFGALTLLAAFAVSAALGARTASAKTAAPSLKIVFVRCSSTPWPCTPSRSTVVRTGHLLVGARGINSRGARVVFPVRPVGRKAGRRPVGGTLRTKTRMVVRVPGDAVSGVIRVIAPGRKASNAIRIRVIRQPAPRAQKPVFVGNASSAAFDGNGMWIWYVSRSSGGTAAGIAAQAKAHGVNTVFVKSADGSTPWSQFNPTFVSALKAQGLHVCAWQFVYPTDPAQEASVAATAASDGADCFVIDAEGAYEGKYAQAQTYIETLRQDVGPDFPIGVTSFPYVDFHPSEPYSVWMQPGGATFNLPQVYWKTIGDSVDTSLAHTFEFNQVYDAPIYPLGQSYDSASASDILRFRALSSLYGARGVSWWDWQEASASEWNAVSDDLPTLAAPDAPAYPTLRANGSKTGSKGDLVVWAQEHLVGAGQTVSIDGEYGPGTASAVKAFQLANGLPQTGALDDATWPVLLRETPVVPTWTSRGAVIAPPAESARASAVADRAVVPKAPAGSVVTGPKSASLHAKHNEIPPGPLHQR